MLVEGDEEGFHPIRSLIQIEGISVWGLLGPGEYGVTEFRFVTSSLLEANQPVLGLPEDAGYLAFSDLQFNDAGITVTWQQQLDFQGARRRVPGGVVVFVFDPLGKLRQIHNYTETSPQAEFEPVPRNQ